MTTVMRLVRAAKLAGFLALGAGRCRLRQQAQRSRSDGRPAARAPGSQQDFVVNVGDRVFFESDSSELTPQSIATLEKQAQWLQIYNQYTFTDRRPCRRARHARIQHRARRPARADRARLSGLARRSGAAHAHDFLRQGAPGRGVQRHFLLVAEPSGRDGAQYQFLSGGYGGRGQPAPSGAGCVLGDRSRTDHNAVTSLGVAVHSLAPPRRRRGRASCTAKILKALGRIPGLGSFPNPLLAAVLRHC